MAAQPDVLKHQPGDDPAGPFVSEILRQLRQLRHRLMRQRVTPKFFEPSASSYASTQSVPSFCDGAGDVANRKSRAIGQFGGDGVVIRINRRPAIGTIGRTRKSDALHRLVKVCRPERLSVRSVAGVVLLAISPRDDWMTGNLAQPVARLFPSACLFPQRHSGNHQLRRTSASSPRPN